MRHILAAVIICALVAFTEDVRGLRTRLLHGSETAAARLSDVEQGALDFSAPWTREAGFGPFFNAPSCASCHSTPSAGGSSAMTVLHAAVGGANGAATASGGFALAVLTNMEPCQPQLPAGTTTVARRLTTPLYGAGLVEAIADETLRALADPEDADGDGISGRAAEITDVVSLGPRVGRFGWKAQHATVLAAVAEAFVDEMGITNAVFPRERTHGVAPDAFKECDIALDPEDIVDPALGKGAIDNMTAFVRTLAPPGRGPIDGDVHEGEVLFREVGCAACHVPRLPVGAHSRPELSQSIEAYSDFLLHDVGGGDGIPQGAAAANEMRTAPLWGLRLRPALMHDGTAATVDRAIRRHAGEAMQVRRGYEALTPLQRAKLIAFLESL